MQIKLEFKPQDLWVGVFWKTGTTLAGAMNTCDVWVCVIPMFPLHIRIERYCAAYKAEMKHVNEYTNRLLEGKE